MKKCLFLAAMLGSSAAFSASGDYYFGIGYHLGDYEETGTPSASPTALKLEYGKYFADFVSIEWHFAFDLSGDKTSFEGERVEFELERAISLFVKGDLNLTQNVNLYWLLGYTRGTFRVSSPDYGVSFSGSDSGLSYGAGIEAITANSLIFSVEYVMYLNEDEYDYSGLNLGITKRF